VGGRGAGTRTSLEGKGKQTARDLPKTLLARLKEGLASVYGWRLKGLYLYGSYAAGEQDEESDLDVLIVLDRVDHYAAEIDRTGPHIATPSLE